MYVCFVGSLRHYKKDIIIASHTLLTPVQVFQPVQSHERCFLSFFNHGTSMIIARLFCCLCVVVSLDVFLVYLIVSPAFLTLHQSSWGFGTLTVILIYFELGQRVGVLTFVPTKRTRKGPEESVLVTQLEVFPPRQSAGWWSTAAWSSELAHKLPMDEELNMDGWEVLIGS